MTNPFPSIPECEIVTTRILNFAPKKIFSAFSNPNHLKEWWGPNNFTNTFHEFDFCEGGFWTFTMHGPEKGNYQNQVQFVIIQEPNLIAWKRHSKPLFNVVFTFVEVETNKTQLIFTMVFETKEECDKLKGFVVDKNEENLDRLEEYLLKIANT